MRYESFIGSLKNRLTELHGDKLKHQLIKMLEHLGVGIFTYQIPDKNDTMHLQHFLEIFCVFLSEVCL